MMDFLVYWWMGEVLPAIKEYFEFVFFHSSSYICQLNFNFDHCCNWSELNLVNFVLLGVVFKKWRWDNNFNLHNVISLIVYHFRQVVVPVIEWVVKAVFYRNPKRYC